MPPVFSFDDLDSTPNGEPDWDLWLFALADSGAEGAIEAIEAWRARHPELARAIEPEGLENASRAGLDVKTAPETERDERIAHFLLARGANPNARSFDDNTPLTAAALRGRLGVLRALLPVTEPDARNGDDETALMRAAMIGDAPCVEFLLSRCDARVSDEEGLTPLIHAASQNAECVRLLLPRSDAQASTKGGVNALMMAAQAGLPQAVEALIPASDLAARDADGYDAFLFAALGEHIECARLLLPHVDPAAAPGGKTALMRAAQTGAAEAVKILLPISDPRAEGKERFTALHFAAQSRDAECVRLLLPGGDPLATTASGDNALSLAARLGWVDCARELLPASNWRAKNHDGANALDICVIFRRWACADLFSAVASPEELQAVAQAAPVGCAPAIRARLEQIELSELIAPAAALRADAERTARDAKNEGFSAAPKPTRRI